jgi:hypothetical protein
MGQWINETSNLSILWYLRKSLINALSLIIFLIPCHQITNKPIRRLTHRIKSFITIPLISLHRITRVHWNIYFIDVSCKPIPGHTLIKLIFFNFDSLALVRVELFHVFMWILGILRVLIVFLGLNLIL